MFSSMCSLKSSMSPRSSLSNLPSSLKDHLQSTLQKQNHDYYTNQSINIQGFQPTSSISNTHELTASLKPLAMERSGSQESFGKAIRQKLNFQKKQTDKDRLNRFKSSQKVEKIERLDMVRSVDGFNSVQCSNSDGKKAKYCVVNSKEHQYKTYCSKCSIMLLQKGYQISEIAESGLYPTNKNTMISSIHSSTYQRAELQQLTVKLNRLQTDIKQQVSNLQHNFFFLTIEQSKQRIESTYDKILELILKMKEADLKELRAAKEQILRQTTAEKKILLNTTKSIETSKNQIFNLSRRLPLVDEHQYKTHVQQALMLIQSNKRYESLEFSIKEQNQEKMIQRIIEEIKGKLLRVVQFSFDNFRKDWNIEECQQSFNQQFRESFKGIFSAYKADTVLEQENEESELN